MDENETTRAPSGPASRPPALPGFLLMVAFLMLCWLGLSDKRDAMHLGMGLFSALLVAALTHGLLAIGVRRSARGRQAVRYVYSFRWARFPVFVAWMALKIAQANIAVAKLLLDPRLPVDPVVERIPTGLRGDLSRTVLSAVITLTPGTIVLVVEDDVFVVHGITPGSLDGIADEFVRMVRATFELPEDEARGGGGGLLAGAARGAAGSPAGGEAHRA